MLCISDNENICLALTVDNLDTEYKKVMDLGVEIISKPKLQPWGAYNMSFYDPDRNIIYLRQFMN